MKLIIDIPEERFEGIRWCYKDSTQCDYLYRIVANGTPLPKEHGRLGDLDALEKLCTEHNIANSAYDNSPIIEQGHYSDGDCIWKSLFDFAPTIIEAERGE